MSISGKGAREQVELRDGTLPWTRSCYVCGVDNPRGLHLRSRLEGGRVVLEYTTRSEDAGYAGIVHGGVLATLLDEVMTWAAIVRQRRLCVAGEMSIRLKAPVPTGEKIRVEGFVVRGGKRLVVTGGRVTNADGRVAAEAEGKYVPMSEGGEYCFSDFVRDPAALAPEEILGEDGDVNG